MQMVCALLGFPGGRWQTQTFEGPASAVVMVSTRTVRQHRQQAHKVDSSFFMISSHANDMDTSGTKLSRVEISRNNVAAKA
jgi:hypothetical protein